MEKYIVGGAVRDFLLAKLNGKLRTAAEIDKYWTQVEKDWVVVGSTPKEMFRLGFRPVGKSFPVFLDPETHEEYALARTERKTGHGYTGFEFHTSSEVTLVEDLKRRDLTINAIAASANLATINLDTVIDPYGGVQDLKQKLFKHVSLAFAEDPVRILRLARLATRFGDFSVHTETRALMKQMVLSGEVDALVPERVWQEWEKSLQENHPWRFFEILEQCGALNKLFPEIKNLAAKKIVLQNAVSKGAKKEIILSLQLYDLAKKELQHLLQQYRIPNHYADLALLVADHFRSYLSLKNNAFNILQLYQQTDAFRRTERFEIFLTACHYLSADGMDILFLIQMLQELRQIDATQYIKVGLRGVAISEEISKARLAKITLMLKGY